MARQQGFDSGATSFSYSKYFFTYTKFKILKTFPYHYMVHPSGDSVDILIK